MEGNLIKVLDQNGVEKQAEIVLKFKIGENHFIIYTFNETDENGMIILYSSLINNVDGKIKFEKISTEDWTSVKQVMNKIVKEWEE